MVAVLAMVACRIPFMGFLSANEERRVIHNRELKLFDYCTLRLLRREYALSVMADGLQKSGSSLGKMIDTSNLHESNICLTLSHCR